MDRPKNLGPSKKGEFECPDSDLLSAWPGVAQGVCDLWWSDGKPREPWSLKFQFSPDQVHLTVTDKESKLVCFTTAPSMKECLDRLEQAIENGGPSWRKSKY